MDSKMDVLLNEDDQFSLAEMENALLQDNASVNTAMLSVNTSSKEPVEKPVKRTRRVLVSRPLTSNHLSSENSSDNSESNTSSANSADSTWTNDSKSNSKKKRTAPERKTILKKKKKIINNKENILENTSEANNRPALIDRTNSCQRTNIGNGKGGKLNAASVHFAADTKKSIPEKVLKLANQNLTESLSNKSEVNQMNGSRMLNGATSADKIIDSHPVSEKEVNTKSVPIYKQAVGSLRLTPPPCENKMDLYEFEVDENEQPTKKKKRNARTNRIRKKPTIKQRKAALENIIVPERTMLLRHDEDKKVKSLKSRKKANPLEESNSSFDYLICIDNRNGNQPNVSLFENSNNDISDGACCGWDENLRPVLVIDSNSRQEKDLSNDYDSLLGWDEELKPVLSSDVRTSPKKPIEACPKALKSCQSGQFRAPTNPVRVAQNVSHNKTLNRSIKHVSFSVPDCNTSVTSIPANVSNSSEESIIVNPLADYSRIESGIQYGPLYSPNSSHCSTTDHQIPRGVSASTPKKLNETVTPAQGNRWRQTSKKADVRSSGGVTISSDVSRESAKADVNASTPKKMNKTVTPAQVNIWRPTYRKADVRFSGGETTSSDVSRESAKADFDVDFGFSVSEDSKDLEKMNKDHSLSDASTSSVSSKAGTEKPKQSDASFQEIINRLKGNVSLTPTPATKQTKLKFTFLKRNKSGDDETIADTSSSISSTIQASTDESELTPSFLKPPRRSYTPKVNKTKKFAATFIFDQDMEINDGDVDDKLIEESTVKVNVSPKKNVYKKHTKAVKKEEKEIERLVSAMNSQFKKIDEFELCVEK